MSSEAGEARRVIFKCKLRLRCIIAVCNCEVPVPRRPRDVTRFPSCSLRKRLAEYRRNFIVGKRWTPSLARHRFPIDHRSFPRKRLAGRIDDACPHVWNGFAGSGAGFVNGVHRWLAGFMLRHRVPPARWKGISSHLREHLEKVRFFDGSLVLLE